MIDVPGLPDDVLGYYNRGGEDERLFQDAAGHLERTRTQELLERWLHPPPASILDVGGGTGHYALWLADRGYTVHLVEAVPLHVEQAQRRSASAGRPLASIQLGDARSLDSPDASFDAILLLGPLYHLTRAAHRVAALREA